jgi:quercetin dioxygenase-like cupin family protein
MRNVLAVSALVAVGFGSGAALGARGFLSVQQGQIFKSPTSGTTLRLLLDERNLGGKELEVGEITFPPGVNSGEHLHGATEIFYVLSGELEHVVNGTSQILKPGMIGFVRPPDKVNHVVPGKEPVKALVIWAPGGEAQRIVTRWQRAE